MSLLLTWPYVFDLGRLDMFTRFEQATRCGRLSEHKSREWIHKDVFFFYNLCRCRQRTPWFSASAGLPFFKWKRVDQQKRNLFPRRSANTGLLKSTFMNIKGWRCVYRDDWYMSTESQVEHQHRNKSIPAQRHIVF